MRIGILGPGALGCVYGGHLAKNHEVIMFSRRQNQADIINDRGLIYEVNGEPFTAKVKAVTNVSEAGVLDMVIILVKGYDTVTALEGILPAIGEDTIVLTLQNGLGNYDNIVGLVNPQNIVLGTSGQGAFIVEEGKACYAGPGTDHIGSYADDKSKAKLCATVLDEAGISAEFDENVDIPIWKKLFINIGTNCITALFERTNSIVVDSEPGGRVAALMIAEACEVAKCIGLDFDPDEEIARFKSIVIRANRSSMLQDIEKGRLTEIDTINGAVARLAESHGIFAPYNKFMTELIHTKETARNLK